MPYFSSFGVAKHEKENRKEAFVSFIFFSETYTFIKLN